jgi:hypothetical protein
MYLKRTNASTSVFRTQAWAQAWVDTWGKDSRLQLIDLGANNNPREMFYRVRDRLKKVLPNSSLHLVGVGCNIISTPRAEYNEISDSLLVPGNTAEFMQELGKISWNQFCLPDALISSVNVHEFESLAREQQWLTHEVCKESSYYVKSDNFSEYVRQLSPSTRLTYFNRRKRLSAIGTVEFVHYPLEKIFDFFKLLNQFHLARWGNACYSQDSQSFLKNFLECLPDEGGSAILEAMLVNGEVVSVLFDVVLLGCRYNFQSGYAENKFSKVALGAVHMGYAIESAIQLGSIYDFMAGEGKHSNYKARIATHSEAMKSINIERGLVKRLRRLQSYL